MTRASRILIIGGLVLALWGMGYGLFYAVFVEHQTLDRLGGTLAAAFTSAAGRQMSQSNASLDAYARASYDYVRQVDVHSHWLGLALVLIVLGLAFERVELPENTRTLVAIGLLLGSILFPLGVILQTLMTGPLPSALAILGAALVTAGLAAAALGLVRSPRGA